MAYMDSPEYRSNRGGGGGRRWNQWSRDQSFNQAAPRDTGYRDSSYAAGPSGRGQNGYRDGYREDYRQGGFQQREDFSRSSRGSGRGSGRYSQRSWGQDPRYAARGRGRGPSQLEPEDIQFCHVRAGHASSVTCMVMDGASGQLYTGAKDGKVIAWTCSDPTSPRPQWNKATTQDVDGPVDSLLFEGGFLFCGWHARGSGPPLHQRGCITVWNLGSGSQDQLEGFNGETLSLAAANGMLFSGGQDALIRVWKFDEASGKFQPMVALSQHQHGGHSAAVNCLVPANPFLFSADFNGNIKIWDMSSGSCTQTLETAHSSTIMDMLAWEGHLVSCALDGLVKVWCPTETPAPGAVLEPQPTYVHGADLPQGKRPPGVLKLAGTVDAAQTPVLLTSANGEGTVYLWELPSFQERGQLRAHDPRALLAGPGGFIMAGESNGELKVWRWKQPKAALMST